MKKEAYNVAVVGATGAVGEEMLKVLADRDFPIAILKPLASSRSAGSKVEFRGKEYPVEELTDDSFEGIDIALFSAGGSVSSRFAPSAASSGAVVIDNTNAFRMESDIPLVVPEVNPHAIAEYRNRGIIANPNCSTIQMVVALKPIYDAAGIKRVVVSTYQAVSGSGKKAIEADPAPFEAAVTRFLKSHAMDMKVYRFRTLHIDGERATANVSLGHAGGATAIKVQWEFSFGKKGNVWQVESYRK